MHDLLTNDLFMIALSGGFFVFVSEIGITIYTWRQSRDQRLADEQEHRQALERSAAQKANRLALAQKLEDVIAIAVADRAISDTLEKRFEKLKLQVRVEAEEDEADAPQRGRRKRR
jgi:hypothetical protein